VLKFERYGIGIAKGMAVTLRNLFRHRVTTQYPEERLVVSRRIRGNQLIWKEDKCTGCATCAKTCPQGAIRVVTAPDEENNYTVINFEVDSGYCIACGLCVEACPYTALFLAYQYELARYRRRELVLDRDELALIEVTPSAYARPELEATLPRQDLLINRKE